MRHGRLGSGARAVGSRRALRHARQPCREQEHRNLDATSVAPLLLMGAAPLTVVATLLWAHNVWLTFAIYHLGICLASPVLLARAGKEWSVPAHLRNIGLLRPRNRPVWFGIRAGLLCGLVMGSGTVTAFALTGDALLRRADLASALAGWGVTSARLPSLFAVMLLGNAFAEELFWRGWAQRRVPGIQGRARQVLLTSALYSAYHALTVAVLTRSVAATALITATILGAGLIWGWLRERYDHVWPALLGHAGATIGYMTVLAVRLRS
jgi:membrane protease YdiL (CAAX protease family)